ncbi:hypothetical protein MBLNU459_g3037t1 [Dothideomycetes sp. NU459]
MAKSMFSAAAAALALSGVVSAFPQVGSGFNTTTAAVGTGALTSLLPSGTGVTSVSLNSTSSTPTSTSSSASSTSTATKYCPNLDGDFIVGPLDIRYQISCGTNHLGVIIDITLQKKATPNSLTDCLSMCSELDNCVAAAYDTTNPTCYLFSSVGAAYAADGFEFAEKASALASSTTTSSAPTAVASSTGNTTYPSNSTSSGNSTSPIENLFCPQLDQQVYSDGNGVSYIIECGDNHVGVVISVANAKRAVATSILDCLAQCDATAGCVGTGYNTVAQTCTLFSSVGAAYYDANVDFALRVADATATTTSAPAGSDIVTATVYTTTLSTVLACPASVTDCPLRGAVVTDTVVAYTTVCPASNLVGAITTGVAAPIACTDCPYAAVTATVYTTTVSTILSCASTVTNCPLTKTNGAGATAGETVTSMVAVATSVVNYPLPQSTLASSASGAYPVGPSATTSGLASFTGAANVLSAGMGMAGAFVAGAAFLL